MMTLEEYKNHLINFCRHACDNTEVKIKERKSELESKYSDLFLQKVIDDTNDFINDIMNSDTLKYGYCSFPLEDDTTNYISFNLTGGWFTDILFTDLNGRVISKYLLRREFGNYFDIHVRIDEIPFEEDDIVSFYHDYSLYMQGFDRELIIQNKNKYLGIKK